MNPFSTYVATALFAEFPEWAALAEEVEDGAHSSYLVVKVTPPLAANVEHGLLIETEDGELTVGFDAYHSHFDKSTRGDATFGITAGLEFVKEIVSERVAAASWWKDTECKASAQWRPGESTDPPVNSDFNRIRVRSWNGTYNLDRST